MVLHVFCKKFIATKVPRSGISSFISLMALVHFACNLLCASKLEYFLIAFLVEPCLTKKTEPYIFDSS